MINFKDISSFRRFFRRYFTRIVSFLFFLYMCYMGYRSWYLLQSSFVVFTGEKVFLRSVTSYTSVGEKLKVRQDLPSLEINEEKNPFQKK